MTSRYIPHDGRPPADLDSVRRDIEKALYTNLRLVDGATYDSYNSVYVGAAGIAFMAMHLEKCGMSVSPHEFRFASDHFWKTLGSIEGQPLSRRRCSFLETDAGVASLLLLRVIRTLNLGVMHNEALGLLQTMMDAHNRDATTRRASQSMDDGDCEVLYGRAGFLYALLLLRSELTVTDAAAGAVAARDFLANIKILTSDSSVKALVDSIVLHGKNGARKYSAELSDRLTPALMWTWHNKRYLGAAHGVAGILHILLLCPSHIVAPYMPDVLQTIEWLMDLQGTSGNWPSHAPDRETYNRHRNESDLVHWCHGAPGTVVLLSTLLRYATRIAHNNVGLSPRLFDRVLMALERGADIIYTRGMLRKGVGLCHGVAGSVYALLAAGDAMAAVASVVDTGHVRRTIRRRDSQWYVRRAAHLAYMAAGYHALTERGEMRMPDRPFSLYEGTAGMCCAWWEVLRRMTTTEGASGMPGFDDIRVDW